MSERVTLVGRYYKDRPEGMQLMSGLPLPKGVDGKVHDIDFVDCSFHPNCPPAMFVNCTFVGCDGPEEW